MEDIIKRLSLIESKVDQLTKEIKSLDNNQRSSFESLNRAIIKISEIVSYISRK